VTVSSTAWSVRRVEQFLEHIELDVVLMIEGGQIEVIEVSVPPAWEGHDVAGVSAPGELLVVAITRRGRAIIPTAATAFENGDRVVVATLPGSQRRLESLLARG
jgi:Trk K+ transport system NAD-binding subunit